MKIFRAALMKTTAMGTTLQFAQFWNWSIVPPEAPLTAGVNIVEVTHG